MDIKKTNTCVQSLDPKLDNIGGQKKKEKKYKTWTKICTKKKKTNQKKKKKGWGGQNLRKVPYISTEG